MKKEGKTTKNYYYGVPLKYAENIGVYLVAKGKGYPVIGISMVENSEYWKKRAYENFNVEQEHKHNKDLLNAIKNITERMVNQ
jgi:hypothetical protein